MECCGRIDFGFSPQAFFTASFLHRKLSSPQAFFTAI